MRSCRVMCFVLASFALPCLAAEPGAVEVPGNYGWVLFRMVMMLGIVCVLAYASLRWGLKKWVMPTSQDGPMEVLARLPIEPRRSLVLVRVGTRVLVVGNSESGMAPLANLSLEEAQMTDESVPDPVAPGEFQAVLQRLSRAGIALLCATPVMFLSDIAHAQVPGTNQSPLTLVALLAGLSLLPFLLVMVTSFVKIAVVLSILRTAIGVQQAPPNQVITGLAMVLSLYVMAPVGLEAWDAAEPSIARMEEGKFDATIANYSALGEDLAAPLRTFLLKHADEDERLQLYESALLLRTEEQRKQVTPNDLLIIIPAFVLTELKEAFTIGFVLFVPFILVDLVVANILLSLGMHMLSPTTVSLPFKLLLFVLVDGWALVIRGLILGYV